MRHRIIPRETWGAADPKGSFTPIASEQDRLWLHHSVTDRVTGYDAPRLMQRIAHSRGFTDISYTHVVDDKGNIYEGRGIGRMGAHTLGDNEDSWAIVVVGNYEDGEPSRAAKMAVAWLTRVYYSRDWDKQLGIDGGHRDAYARGYCTTNTACPGKYLHARIGGINRWARRRAWLDGLVRRKPDPARLPILRKGDEGTRVKLLQELLSNIGTDIPQSGVFDNGTLVRVRQFQANRGLTVDGVVGQLTWAELLKYGWKA